MDKEDTKDHNIIKVFDDSEINSIFLNRPRVTNWNFFEHLSDKKLYIAENSPEILFEFPSFRS